MKRLSINEKENLISIFKCSHCVKLGKLKENYVEIITTYFKNIGVKDYSISSSDIEKLDLYKGSFYYIFYDDIDKGEVFILDDNNVILHESCFEIENI